jgi:hypothetical protein
VTSLFSALAKPLISAPAANIADAKMTIDFANPRFMTPPDPSLWIVSKAGAQQRICPFTA